MMHEFFALVRISDEKIDLNAYNDRLLLLSIFPTKELAEAALLDMPMRQARALRVAAFICEEVKQ
jgi:hypothetical protein